MSNKLEKLINLSRKTGDRIIVFDPKKEENAYVIMPVEDYEKIVIGKNEVRGLTEDEMLDKINRDIAIWKSDGKFDMEAENSDAEKFEEWDGEEEESDYEKLMNWEERKDEKAKKSGNKWGIPKTREEAAEEVIKEEDVPDEDTQYLEEIKF